MEYYSALKKKEILPYATTWMNLKDIMLSEINQSQKTKSVWFHFCEVPRVVKLIETENRMVTARGWGRRMENCLLGAEFQFCKIKCSGDWLHNNMNVLNTTELYT